MTANQHSLTDALLKSTHDEPQVWNLEELEEFDEALPENEAAFILIKHIPSLLNIKKRPDLFTVSDNIRTSARAKRIAVLQVIKLKIAWGKQKLPDQILCDVGEEFSVSDRQVQRWVNNYIAYRRVYPKSPGAEVFLPLRTGPEPKQQFTDDQEAVLLYAIAVRVRFLKSAIGKIRKDTIPFSVLDIYNFAKSVFDRLNQPFPAYNTVLKFVNRVKEQEPELFYYMKLGRKKGRRFVEEELLPKRKNDVSGPNRR